MASGDIVSEDKGTRQIQRYTEKNVYTRKVFRGSKNKVNLLNVASHNSSAATTETVPATVTADGTKDNGNSVSVQQSARVSDPEDGNSVRPVVVNSRLDVVSEDLSSRNLRQDEHFSLDIELEDATGSLEPSLRNCVTKQGQDNGVENNLETADGTKDNGNSVLVQQPARVLAPEDGNSVTPVVNSRLDVVSEDLSSQNLRQDEHFSLDIELEDATGSLEPSLRNCVTKQGQENSVENNLVSLSKQETLECTRRLGSDLETADGTKDNGNSVSVQQPATVSAPEDGNSVRPVVSSRLDAVSEDLSSRNLGQDEHFSLDIELEDATGSLEPSLRNCVTKQGQANVLEDNLDSRSKQETRERRRKLESDLETVRSLVNRIEEKQGMIGRYGGNLNVSVDRHRVDNGGGAKRTHSDVASAGLPREPTRPLRPLSVMVYENGQGIGESVEKEKRTPKANQFYYNSEFLLAKDKFPPAESNKKSKLNGKKHGRGDMGHGHGIVSKYLKSCSSLLEKLMKHKHGWVFNTPVNVEALGLHDYFIIISHPMDLGTVKSRLNKNWYKSPKEFAEDVRLTFRNAMTYNPKGQDVHVMAEELSALFEDKWAIIESNYNHEMRYAMDYGPSLSAPSPLSRKTSAFRPPPLDMRRILDRSESMTNSSKPMNFTRSARTPAPKKPKANDPHKREMTYEEKQKLSTQLQSLPSEKLDAIVQIIKKRNSALSQHDDEIEVDIDSVDAETLWELDRFVTNFKKSLSKYKRKAELAMQKAELSAQQKSQAPPVIVEVPRERQADERNAPPSSTLQGEIRVDNGSKTSSSSSSSSDSGSSSSDSDSDSSSASGSDAGSQ